MLVNVNSGWHRRTAFVVWGTLALCLAMPARAAEPPQPPAPDAGSAPAAPPPAAPSPSASPSPASPSSASPPAASPSAPPEGVKRVVYIPESLKAELRKQIQEEVLAQAKAEGWAAPNVVPEWLKRIRLSGDVRARWERDLYANGNAAMPDFNAVNTGQPFDVNPVDYANDRYVNVDQDRTRPRLRARLGVDADVTAGFTAGVRLATGESSSPVSTNQTLGGSGGNFSKYAVWLDRGFIRWTASEALAVDVGRFANPFFATELVWSDSVSFDGLAVQASGPSGGAFRPFVVAGAFPLYTTPLNFPAELPSKYASSNRWLYAAQVGTAWKPSEPLGLKLGVAYYEFDHIQGRLSSPCDTNLKNVTCDTDDTRPSFAQKGNSYFPLRTPSAAALAAEATGLASRYQYFGLSSLFRELVLTARAELLASPTLKVTVEGEAVRNLGFSARRIAPLALNNRDQCDAKGNCAHYAGGRDGVLGRVVLGSPGQELRGSWNAGLTYRRLESDAVVDAFTDPDFGLGGTNLQGYVLAAGFAVADRVWTTARWFSADEIVGPHYRVDVLLLDLQARF